MKALPRAIEKQPMVAFMVILGISFGSACNLTVAEWRDAVDASSTTAWQPELVVDAWWDGIRAFALAMYAYWTRSTKRGTSHE